MATLANLARMTTATVGTGTITLGSATADGLTFAEAGITNGQTISYAIEDGNEREVGRGVYTSSGTTLTRSVLGSTNGGSAISLSGDATVFITAIAQDIRFTGAMVRKAADQTGANYTTLTAIAFDQEIYDTDGFHDNSVANTRLTVPSTIASGFAVLTGNVVIANQTGDTWSVLVIEKDGSVNYDGHAAQRVETGVSPSLSVVTGPVPVVAGSYFELFLQTESDTSIDITALRTNFSIQIVG